MITAAAFSLTAFEPQLIASGRARVYVPGDSNGLFLGDDTVSTDSGYRVQESFLIELDRGDDLWATTGIDHSVTFLIQT